MKLNFLINHRYLSCPHFLGVMFLMISIPYSQDVIANRNKILASKSDLRLESQVWNSPASKLQDIERKVIQILQNEPHSVYAHYLLSYLYIRIYSEKPYRINLLKKAINIAQQAINLNPQSDLGYIAHANIMIELGQEENALQLLQSMNFKKTSHNWRTEFLILTLTMDNKNKDLNIIEFEKVIKKNPESIDIISPYISDIFTRHLTISEQEQYFMSWYKMTKNPQFLLSLSNLYTSIGYHKKSYSFLKKIESSHQLYTKAEIKKNILLYRHLNQPKKAMNNFLKLLNSKANISKKDEETILTHKSILEIKYGENKIAKKSIFKLLNDSENPIGILNTISSSYERKEFKANLARVLEESLANLAGDPEYYRILGSIYSLDLGMQNKAIISLSKSITLDPENSSYYNEIGLVYYRKKEYANALNMFNASIHLDELNATALYNKACILSINGDFELAILSLESAIDIDPNLQIIAGEDPDFRNIRESSAFKQMIETHRFTNIEYIEE